MTDGVPAIATFGLGKRYAGSDKYAVKNLNLNIMPGEVYGFLGPNGAGKSTTIRLLMNFIQPTEGHAIIKNQNVVTDSVEIKRDIGYLAGEVTIYPKMTGRQFLDYMQALQPPKRKGFVHELAKTFQVDLSQKIGALSKGNRQKIAVLQAFAAEPEVLILDEPTASLDPLMQEAFFELIHLSRIRGATIFFSSHNLAEVQKICDRVGFIRNGKLIAQQSIADLSTQATQTYSVSFAEMVPLVDLRRIPKAKVIAHSSHHAVIQMRGDLRPLFMILTRHKVTSLERREDSLEEEFLRFYKGGKP
ncbi:MAG: ABC transporter ATP-binding protein [Patescibacteria group bacterium]